MPSFFLAASDDPLGKATTNDIVVTSVTPTVNQQLVDILSEQGIPIKSSAVLIEALQQVVIAYELKSSLLVLPLGVDINGFRVSALTANCTSRGYPTVNVTAVKPVNGSFATIAGDFGSVTIVGGFGMVNLFGGTCAQPSASSLSIASQQVVVTDGNPGATLGQILTAGIAVFAYRQTCTLEGYVDPTAPAGSKVTAAEGPNKTREGVMIYRKNWTSYLIDN